MQTCALVIGHQTDSPGASNANSQITEFEFNQQLAEDIRQQVNGVRVKLVYRQTYQALPDQINQLQPDFIISLHCNAFNQQVSGTETLFYHKSAKGRQMAQLLNDELVQALQLKNRGVKAKHSEDRGGYLLRYTHAPCVIAEPFFIDNDADLAVAQTKRSKLIKAYADSVEQISLKLF